jgi:hypothetical protein
MSEQKPTLVVPLAALLQRKGAQKSEGGEASTDPPPVSALKRTSQFTIEKRNKNIERESTTRQMEAPIMEQTHVSKESNRSDTTPATQAWVDHSFQERLNKITALQGMKNLPSDLRNAAIAREFGLETNYNARQDTADMFVSTAGKALAIGLGVVAVGGAVVGIMALGNLLMPVPVRPDGM